MNTYELQSVAQELVAESKGILAADESTGTITRRLRAVQVQSTEDSRRAYRELLFTTPGIASHLSGVILYDETIRQNASDGTALRKVLTDQGIMPGIKVDLGAKDLPFFPSETITEGLDGLRERVAEYRALGATFAKWRSVIRIGEGLPTRAALVANADAMARYAALCQEGGLVPIVEPEVLMDGAHSIAQCEEVTTAALQATFLALAAYRVLPEGLLLKPNMVLPGTDSREEANVAAVAEATLRTLRRTVPAAVPGVVFLSGGQSPELAAEHLNAIAQLGPHPWEVSFSFARALQGPAMEAWGGRAENVNRAQATFQKRVMLAGMARQGRYTPDLERGGALQRGVSGQLPPA